MKPFHITFDDYKAAQSLHGGRRLRLMLAVILILVGLAAASGDLLSGDSSLSPTTFIAIGVVAILMLIVFPYATRWKYKQIYNANEALREEVSVRFDVDGIVWQSPSGNYRCQWQDILETKTGKHIILLYEAKNRLRIIPFRAFESESERSTFTGHLPVPGATNSR